MFILTWVLSVALLERPVWFSTPLDELEECYSVQADGKVSKTRRKGLGRYQFSQFVRSPVGGDVEGASGARHIVCA